MIKRPLHESEVESDTWYEGTDREIRGKGLSDVGGRAKVGVGLLELPPGSNTLPAHYHTREDEHLYVIEGELVLYLGIEVFELVADSYVHFPAGQAVAHHLANESGLPARYLMVGERIDDDQVIYP
jgi:uncharacterized cupin superfamily protein